MTTTPIHTLVHIGAGNGSQLPEYESLAPARLVLIEPLPAYARALRQATAGMLNTEVWELAVSCTPSSEAKLTEYNLASASSLHPATGLSDLFPGIKVVQQHSVTAISPQTLIERLQLDPKQNNQLIVEASGAEQEILGNLLEQNMPTLFRYIQVSMSEIPLYQSRHSPGELLSKLESHCFELINTDNSDPDIPLWQLALNPVKQDLAITQSALQQANVLNGSLQQQLEVLQQKLKAETQEKENIKQQLQANTEAVEKLNQQKDQLAKEKVELTKHKAHSDELSKQNGELQQQLKGERQAREKVEKQFAAITQELGDIKQQHQQLTQSQTELQKTLTTLNQQFQAEKQDKEKTQQQLNQSNGKVDQLKQTCDQLTKDNNTLKIKENLLLDLQGKHADLQQKHQKLLSEHQTTQSRQQLLEGELLKAEAQIELIKELMLSGSAI